MPMAEFEPGSSGVGSDRSANCATTTATKVYLYCSSPSLGIACSLPIMSVLQNITQFMAFDE